MSIKWNKNRIKTTIFQFHRQTLYYVKKYLLLLIYPSFLHSIYSWTWCLLKFHQVSVKKHKIVDISKQSVLYKWIFLNSNCILYYFFVYFLYIVQFINCTISKYLWIQNFDYHTFLTSLNCDSNCSLISKLRFSTSPRRFLLALKVFSPKNVDRALRASTSS